MNHDLFVLEINLRLSLAASTFNMATVSDPDNIDDHWVKFKVDTEQLISETRARRAESGENV